MLSNKTAIGLRRHTDAATNEAVATARHCSRPGVVRSTRLFQRRQLR